MNPPAKFGANRMYRFQVIQHLVKLMFSSAAILDFKKWHILSISLSGLWQAEFPCRIWCIQDEPLRCNSIFSKIHFVVGGHLGFWKMAASTRPVSGRCHDEALCQIWWESD